MRNVTNILNFLKNFFRNSQSRSRNGNGGSRTRYGRQQYSESHCWNGKDTGRYTNNIVGKDTNVLCQPIFPLLMPSQFS